LGRGLLLIAVGCVFLAATVAITLTLVKLVPLTGTGSVTATPAATLPAPSVNMPFGDSGTALAFGPGGTLADGDLLGNVSLWDTATRKITAALGYPAHNVPVSSVAFGPGSTVATATDSGNVYVWHISP
jgi:WD40 repeat protein